MAGRSSTPQPSHNSHAGDHFYDDHFYDDHFYDDHFYDDHFNQDGQMYFMNTETYE
ncbi:hypothetical protein LTR78_003659 [Recurvomyces mirabilis]|uniref:Uncharacterized protein n=1 Tax=Recurvomyces mirabilis TaxID=574656 RepID=A0AAE0WQY2_9PEZI|nr:hypothetical protein LTR78_003659 [Recurvomyces mirabilis]KAK5154771.1 hypothetical protein LTS14_006352 [Recurvomyces mirabilis]